MLIGYIRPLQDDLECEEQKNQLLKNNCEKIIQESHASAKIRTELERLMGMITEQDTIVVTKLYVLADSTHHLVELMEEIERKRAFFISVDEKIDTSKKEGYPFSYIVKHVANFQSEVISEKTKKGMNKAKQKGISTGRPRKPDEKVQRAILMYKSKKYTLKEIREETGISKSTLYRYLEN
ncbi:recombinase family protein [Pseudogracilibacillus sp. SO30301A]|uniref:recombinase family protein n=1 Tax=Pseudogracilibacillus sp. SO30301A TaxID=3098291 RepID=UPI00300DFE39